MSTVAHDPPVRRGALWFGLFGGAVAWTIHLMFAYAIAEFGCVGWSHDRLVLGLTRVAMLEILLTLVTAGAGALATFVAWKSLRQLPAEADASETRSERSTAWIGVLTSGTFTFVILFESIPILFYLRDC